MNYIDKPLKLKLAPTHFITPRIHGLIKIHKQDKPLRPIVNNINGPTYALSKFLNSSLNNLNSMNDYDIKNSLELKEKLKSLHLDNHIKYDIVSFDVQSLFTNIPLQKMIELVETNWEHIEDHTVIKNKKLFIEGIKLCTFNSYFKQDNNYYRQIYGLPMGSSLSVNLSGIVLNDLITTQLKTTKIKPILIAKYIDDLLLILPKNEYPKLLDTFNSYNDRLKFTVEMPDNDKLPFLDIVLVMNRNNSSIATKWYKKEIASNRLLNFHSNHPKSQIINTMNNYIKRAISVTDNAFLKEIRKQLYNILLENFYPKRLVNDAWYRIKNSIDNVNQDNNTTSHISRPTEQYKKEYFLRSKTKEKTEGQSLITQYFDKHNQKNDSEQDNRNINDETNKITNLNKFCKIKYIPSLTNKITSVFRDHDFKEIKFAKYNDNKINTLISNMKDKIKMIDKVDTVYKLNCMNCDKVYIGESKQHLKKRIQQHQYDSKQIKINNKTALCQHSVL
ncbi:uncharacterized protein [Onthophagus taurus]|uniref:uncharacterized protein n=1 Tax=Onthophagus taurus TaxID=166361 RepID=UPI0039BDD2BA